jgi:hypothetical protein
MGRGAAFGPLLTLNGRFYCQGLRGDRADAARCSAHVLRAGKDRPSPLTSLRSMPHRLDPIDGGACSPWKNHPRVQTRKSGGQRSEVKGEKWAKPISEDMSGVARPTSSARAGRRSESVDPTPSEATQPASRSGLSRKSAPGRKPPARINVPVVLRRADHRRATEKKRNTAIPRREEQRHATAHDDTCVLHMFINPSKD